MSARAKAAGSSTKPATSKATRRTIGEVGKANQQQRLTQASVSADKRGPVETKAPLGSPSASRKLAHKTQGKDNKSVITAPSSQRPETRLKSSPPKRALRKPQRADKNDESSSSSQEMTMTSSHGENPGSGGTRSQARNSCQNSLTGELRETNIDRVQQPETDDDDESTTLLESCSSDLGRETTSGAVQGSAGVSDPSAALSPGWQDCSDKEQGAAQRTRPTDDKFLQLAKVGPVLYHDDEEINQSSSLALSTRRGSSDESEFLESGAALTAADDTTVMGDSIAFIVYPTGCCEFDETQLVTANSTKAIQKCIFKLTGQTDKEDKVASRCWGLDQSQPILMRVLEDHIQFSEINSHALLRSQPIQTIKTWAVDGDNNFAFVVEDQQLDSAHRQEDLPSESVEFALLNGPTFICYVFSSTEDDDMSVKVANKLNQEINRYRELMARQVNKSTRSQQASDTNPLKRIVAQTVGGLVDNADQTDADEDFDDAITTMVGGDMVRGGNVDGGNEVEEDVDDDDDDVAGIGACGETSIRIKYIGKVQVPRPMGIDVLNVAIDKSLAEASKAQMERLLSQTGASEGAGPSVNSEGQLEIGSPLVDAKIHVSPSSVIVENEQTGDIIVECRIRYLTFMGISRRDIRWCGFIMQNTTNKTFEAHCIECTPTAGHVCETIQASCSRMYEKMVKGQRRRQQVGEAASIMPKTSKIRDTLARTFSKIKLTPIIQ